MTERLRFGLVGCGVIGPVHAEALSRLPDAVLVSVADLIPERAQTLQKIFPVAFGDHAQGPSCSVEREYCPPQFERP